MKKTIQITITRECAECALGALEYQLVKEQESSARMRSEHEALTKLVGLMRVGLGLQTAAEM